MRRRYGGNKTYHGNFIAGHLTIRINTCLL
jgi:hypothetical protein